jgi:hypothetical protein
MDDLIKRGPQNAAELLLWLDPVRWQPRPAQTIWERMVQALGAAGWHGMALKQLAKDPKTQQELQRIRDYWVAEGLPVPWQNQIDIGQWPGLV